MINKIEEHMKKNLLLLLSLIVFGESISAMESNSQNHGEAAIKNYPNAWLATKIAGGATGSVLGLFGFAACAALGDVVGTVASRGVSPARQKFERLKFIAFAVPFVYGGYKGGEAVSKALWYPAWNGVDKIQKFKESIKK